MSKHAAVTVGNAWIAFGAHDTTGRHGGAMPRQRPPACAFSCRPEGGDVAVCALKTSFAEFVQSKRVLGV